MRHPFELDLCDLEAVDLPFEERLTDEEAAQVGGGILPGGSVVTNNFREGGGDLTTMAIGEEGGSAITMAIGESGGDLTTMAIGEEGGSSYVM